MKWKYDILGLGSTAIDEILEVARYPHADGKAQIAERRVQPGGLTGTALVAAQRLGASCAYAGVLGTDEDSEFVLRHLRQEGIHLGQMIRRRQGRPIRAVIVVESQRGTRTIFYQTPGMVGAHRRQPNAELIRSSRVLFVDRFGMPGMIRAAGIARRAGNPVVGDFETTNVPGIEELLGWVDHLIVPHAAASRLTGHGHASTAAKALRARGHQIVVVTCGERGCYYQDHGMAKPFHFPAFPVPAVDTTGCGDVFHGAYAMALAKQQPLAERIRVASAAAALKATRCGGQTACPTSQELEKFLHSA